MERAFSHLPREADESFQDQSNSAPSMRSAGSATIVGPLNLRRGRQSLYTLILFDFPAIVGIRDTCLRRITAEDEGGAITNLGPGGNAQAPYHRGDLITAWTQKRRQIVCFVLPVRKITPCRTASYLALVDVENEQAVGADVDYKMFRDTWNLDHFPEMQNHDVALRCAR